jgi:hypothetical protein
MLTGSVAIHAAQAIIRFAGRCAGAAYRLLGARDRLQAAIGPRQQQRAFELAEDHGRGDVCIARRHAEAKQPALHLELPFWKAPRVARAEDVGLRRRRSHDSLIGRADLILGATFSGWLSSSAIALLAGFRLRRQ